MKEIYSSVASHVDYVDGALLVKWRRGGKVSAYLGVPEKLAEQVMNAASVGGALRESIQGRYEHRYVTPKEPQ